MEQKTKSNILKFIAKTEPYLELLGDLSNIIVHISAKPKPKDYIAISMSLAGLAVKLKNKIKIEETNLFSYFENNQIDKWYINSGLKKFLYENCDDIFTLEKTKDQKILKMKFGNEFIFILADKISDSSNESAGKDRDFAEKKIIINSIWGVKHLSLNNLYKEIYKKIWISNQYIYVSGETGLSYKKYKNYSNYDETSFIKEMLNKIQLAKDNDFLGRGFLILGKPGTGKTTGIDYILSKNNKKTLRVNMDFLDFSLKKNTNLYTGDEEFYMNDLLNFIEIVKPEFVIFDDIDYLHSWDQKRMLHMLSELIENKAIVIASINNIKNLLKALQRPGRLDETIIINEMDEKILSSIVPKEDMKYKDLLKNIPIAHIKEYLKRKKMYSEEEALNFVNSYLKEDIEETVKDD